MKTKIRSGSGYSVRVKDLKCSKYLDLSKYPHITEARPGLVYMGRIVFTNKYHYVKESDIKSFCLTIKTLIDEGYLISYLLAPISMEVATIDKEGKTRKDDGSKLIMTPDHMKDKSICPITDLQYRSMLLFYFVSTYTKEQINERIGKQICCSEGSCPEMW